MTAHFLHHLLMLFLHGPHTGKWENYHCPQLPLGAFKYVHGHCVGQSFPTG